MIRCGSFSFLVTVAFIATCLFPALAGAEVLTQNFDHSLGIGTSAQSYEHRIDIPENLSAKGRILVKRTLALSGKLVIEREELKGTYYYVKVRLPKSWIGSAKGAIQVTLETAGQSSASPVLDAPTQLFVREPALYPNFSWVGAGKYTAITILDRNTNATAWERVLVGASKGQMDEGNLSVGHHYLWAVKQSDETGRYSTEAKDAFRVDTRYERCNPCLGTGWVRCGSCGGSGYVVVTGPNGQPISQPCRVCNGSGRELCNFCRGSGRVEVPVLIHE